jgi:cytochrome c oxidase assembly factor CtaG
VPAWPPARRAFWFAGLAVLAGALAGPLATYDRALFWVHMCQHLAVTLVAAPLLVLGAPLALHARATHRRFTWVAHSAPIQATSHPLVAWCAFALATWITHFSPLYDLALESDLAHAAEHALLLGTALLFWWPVCGVDPGAHRLSHPLRLLYLAAALPLQSFTGLAIYSAGRVLYAHYGSAGRGWGPSALADQRLAGAIMWIGGDAAFVVALGLAALAWMRHDQREAERVDRRLGLR